MLNERHLATIRAALRYWQDEMASHNQTMSRPYFRELEAKPLNPDEVSELIHTLESTIFRPVIIDSRTGQVISNSPEDENSLETEGKSVEATLLFYAKAEG